jgi:hypothetical protein
MPPNSALTRFIKQGRPPDFSKATPGGEAK